MRKKLFESENDVILNSIYELTRFYDDGKEVPTYFNINEITDNYGLTNKEVIDIAQSHGYNVYRIPGNDTLVTSIIIAHEDLSYGDIIEENTTKVDIKELGDSTKDSFNMEEDMEEVKPFTQRQIFDELKRETNNFTTEDTFRYYFFEEQRMAVKILEKHYDDVDWWSDDDRFAIDHTVYLVSFKNPKKGKKKVVKESNPLLDLELSSYKHLANVYDKDGKLLYQKAFRSRPELDNFVNTLNIFDMSSDKNNQEYKGKLFGGNVWKVVISEELKESANDSLLGKEVTYKGKKHTIKDIEDNNGSIVFRLDDNTLFGIVAFKSGIAKTNDKDVQEYVDSKLVVEEPKKEEPRDIKSDDEIYREKARDDFYASSKKSALYKDLDKQLSKGNQLTSYEMAYYREYTKLLNSPIERARRRTNNSNITISKTYKGDVDELINWLKKAIVRIDVFTNEDNKDDIESIVTELNKQHGTNYEAKINTSKDGDQFVVTITSDENILKDMPEEFKTWTAPKNLGLHRANAEKVDALVYNDKNRRLTSNGIIKDLLYNYDFKLGDYKEKNESIDREIDDGPEHGYATVADYERGQEILDEMSALREKERVEEEKLIRAWAVEKTLSDEDFHKQSEELHTSTQEAVEKLYQELVALPVKKNESIARMIYDTNKDKKANNKKVKIIYGSSPKEAKANEPIKVTLKQLQDYKDNYSYVEVIEESIDERDTIVENSLNELSDRISSSVGELSDRIASYLDERDIDAWVEETNGECVDVGTDNEEDFNKIKSVLDEKCISYEDISGGAPKYWGVRVWPSLKEEVENHEELIYKVVEKLKDNINSFEDELITLSQIEGVDVEEIKQREPMQIAKALVEEGIVDFRMFEDIEKHDTLNPKLFDGEELKPEVKEAIQKIVDEFIKELSEDEVNFTLKDIILLGSNVSYNYTKDSDLDIHLIADSSALDCPESLVDKLYGAYRSIFNKNYDITIKDIPVEIYVELDEGKGKSNGVYSLNNGWIKKPEVKDIPDLDEDAFDNLFTIWENDYFDLLDRDSTSEEVAQFIENIYELRKESIAEEGEYGLGNLVFKEFRNLGYLDRLKDLRKEIKGKELSLESINEEMIKDNANRLRSYLNANNGDIFIIMASDTNKDIKDTKEYKEAEETLKKGIETEGMYLNEPQPNSYILKTSLENAKKLAKDLGQDEFILVEFKSSNELVASRYAQVEDSYDIVETTSKVIFDEDALKQDGYTKINDIVFSFGLYGTENSEGFKELTECK